MSSEPSPSPERPVGLGNHANQNDQQTSGLEGPNGGQLRQSTEKNEGLGIEDLSSNIESNDWSIRSSGLEVEAARLDNSSIGLEFNNSLRKSVEDLITGTIKAIRRAYEAKVKAEIKAEWGRIVRKWLQDEENERRLDMMAQFDEHFRQQWLAENVPKMQQQLENRAEAEYHRYREVRGEAERRWEREDYAGFWNYKVTQRYSHIEAELRQELEKGVVAALRAEHMGRLKEEARRQVAGELMEHMREQARQGVKDDKPSHENTTQFARGFYSSLSSSSQKRSLKSPVANLRAQEQAFNEQLKDRMPGTRTPSPVRDVDIESFLSSITPTRSWPDLEPDTAPGAAYNEAMDNVKANQKSATRANNLKRNRDALATKVKEEDDHDSHPPAKRTRAATNNSAADITLVKTEGASATISTTNKQQKRRPGRPSKAKGP